MDGAQAGVSYFRVVVAGAATLWLLITVRDFLQPLLIGLVVFALINAVAATAARALGGADARATPLIRGASALVLLVVLVAFSLLVARNLETLARAAPLYKDNVDAILTGLSQALGLPAVVQVAELVAGVDTQALTLSILGAVANAFSVSIIVLFYVIFMFVEQGALDAKLAALSRDGAGVARIAALRAQIGREIERYLAVKIALGFIQALPTYLVLSGFGVDGAAFWALVIFFFSFVPTIGTMVGILFPAMMTLAQFGDPGRFLTVLGILAAVQMVGSNALEPRMMGKSLNLSPLAVFAAIFAGGALWGIVGALIVVPVLSILLIVFARIPVMRPVAILLSADGRLHGAAEAPMIGEPRPS